jgi:DNA-binding NarL/FixJ family response regulator
MTKAGLRAKVLVVDDHPIVRQGLSELLNRQTDALCCGEAGSLAEAEKAIAAQKPDLVLLDLRLGHADGLETIKALKAQFAEVRILVISQFDETIYAERALRAGARGYVMKGQATEEVLRAIRTVISGQIYVSPAISMMALKRILEQKPAVRSSNLLALSDRELFVFRAVGAGKGNKEIAAELNLSVKTIETYREHIKYKLGLASGAELVVQARAAAEAEVASALRQHGSASQL